jgi:hypothetical protein
MNERTIPYHSFPALTSPPPRRSLYQGVQHRRTVPTSLKSLSADAEKQWLETKDARWDTLIQAAWAIVLRSYTGDDYVHFGLVDMKSDVEVNGLQSPPFKIHRYGHRITGSTIVKHLIRTSPVDCLYEYPMLAHDNNRVQEHSGWLFSSCIYIHQGSQYESTKLPINNEVCGLDVSITSQVLTSSLHI